MLLKTFRSTWSRRERSWSIPARAWPSTLNHSIKLLTQTWACRIYPSRLERKVPTLLTNWGIDEGHQGGHHPEEEQVGTGAPPGATLALASGVPPSARSRCRRKKAQGWVRTKAMARPAKRGVKLERRAAANCQRSSKRTMTKIRPTVKVIEQQQASEELFVHRATPIPSGIAITIASSGRRSQCIPA